MKIKLSIPFYILLFSLAFSSCKKDEETPDSGSTALPAGNYVKFKNSTYLEKDWGDIKYSTSPGDRRQGSVYINGNNVEYMAVTFVGEPQDKTYTTNSSPDANSVAVAFVISGSDYYPSSKENPGTVTVTTVNGKKQIEIHTAIYSPFGKGDGQLDARFIWPN